MVLNELENHIKGIDQKNSFRITEYRKNPIDYCCKWSLPSKQVEKETKLQSLMTPFKNDQISLFESFPKYLQIFVVGYF